MLCGNCQRDIADYSNFCYFCGARQHLAPSDPPRASRRLMRSVVDSKIAGVCGGIAEYLEIDSTLVRLIWLLLILMPVPVVPAIVGYLVAWIVMPLAPYPVRQPEPPAAATPHSTPAT
ncbi:MAG TPA: PspC domain-containing protein [Candidatus Acidoferrales bacterium]|nr:PspC domain-containing protein [Candidatus Acidoferrales bacterium]